MVLPDNGGFPQNPPEPVDLPVVEGVRPVTQDPAYDPSIDGDPEED